MKISGTSCFRRSCPHAAVSIAFLAIATVTTAQAYPLFAEDKRQGLIPFPRVGRSNLQAETSELDDLYSDDPLAAFVYSRTSFNPRLGRKKRSVQDGGDTMNSLELEEIGELLRRTPWSILSYKENLDKKNQLAPSSRGASMAPRLGRTRSDGSSLLLDTEMETSKRLSNPSFAPRLGRSSYELSPDYGRSFPRPNFNPRLGRSISQTNLSPRLGRSTNNEDTKMA